MAHFKAPMILILIAFARSTQAQEAPLGANISLAEAEASAEAARRWMQMKISGRSSGSDCSGDKCIESCEQGWEKNGDHCFFWGTNKKKWTDAEDFCQELGGHLASVTSNATKDFVVEGMNRTGLDSAWIGGNDIEEEGVWKWTDCTPWEVTFWAPGQPSRDGDCLHHVFNMPWATHLNHKWNDWNCDSRETYFLCSKKICSGEGTTTMSTTNNNNNSSNNGDSVMSKVSSVALVAALLINAILF